MLLNCLSTVGFSWYIVPLTLYKLSEALAILLFKGKNIATEANNSTKPAATALAWEYVLSFFSLNGITPIVAGRSIPANTNDATDEYIAGFLSILLRTRWVVFEVFIKLATFWTFIIEKIFPLSCINCILYNLHFNLKTKNEFNSIQKIRLCK